MIDTKQLRQKILDLAIRGKLVPQDPNDEPASVLLERIKAEKERLVAEGKIKRSKKSAKVSDKPHYENVPFEIPESWEWVTLSSICSFLSRGKSPKYADDIKKYPVFAQKCNLYNGDISLEKARFLDPNTLTKWQEEYKLRDGDVLVNSTGTGTVGRTRLFHSDVLGDYPFVVPDSHVSVVRTFDEIISRYAYAYMLSNHSKKYMEDNLAGSTNQRELYIEVLENLLFPIPPHKEQIRIVAEIDKLFAIIDEIENGKSNLQEFIKHTKSKILDLAIHGKLVSQDLNDEPAIDLLKRINPDFVPCDISHYENLPDSWCGATISDLGISVINGFAFQSKKYTAKGIKVVRITNVQDGYISDNDPKYYQDCEEINRYKLKEGDLLMSLTGNVGRVGFLPKTMLPAALNQRVACLRTEEQTVLKKYLFYFLMSEKFKEDCINSGKGVAQLNVSTEWLKQYIIPLPPKAEQFRIVNQVEAVFAVLNNISAEL